MSTEMELAGSIAAIEWVGGYLDATAVVRGRKIRVWFSKPTWKAEIDVMRIGKRGRPLVMPGGRYASNKREARHAALEALRILEGK